MVSSITKSGEWGSSRCWDQGLTLTMVLFWMTALAIIALSNGIEEEKLWTIPQPMKGFQWEHYLGRWFFQFKKVPCSWSRFSEFTDLEGFITIESKDSLLLTETFRNDLCNTIVSRIVPESTEGVYKIKDPVGGGFDGFYINVAGNPKTFRIVYACTKLSVFGNKCEDAMINISTRMPFPNKKVISQINEALMVIWGVTVNQLSRVPKIQSCISKNRVESRNRWLSNSY